MTFGVDVRTVEGVGCKVLDWVKVVTLRWVERVMKVDDDDIEKSICWEKLLYED